MYKFWKLKMDIFHGHFSAYHIYIIWLSSILTVKISLLLFWFNPLRSSITSMLQCSLGSSQFLDFSIILIVYLVFFLFHIFFFSQYFLLGVTVFLEYLVYSGSLFWPVFFNISTHFLGDFTYFRGFGYQSYVDNILIFISMLRHLK
jgi:hypothetical protein